MHRYLLLLAFAASPAMASLASVTCDGVTTEGTLTASCDGTSVNAATMIANGYPDILNLSVGGYMDSASFYSAYQLLVDSGVSNGWFAPTFIVSNWADVSIAIDGFDISQSEGTHLTTFADGQSLFTLSVSGTPGASVEVVLDHMWTPSGSSITPDYELFPTTLPIPEPVTWVPVAIGLLLILACRRQ
jgi:hypothetical protein